MTLTLLDRRHSAHAVLQPYDNSATVRCQEVRGYLEYYGMDINPACARFAGEGVSIFIGDQGDKTFVESVAQELPPPDVVVDDGGHVASQQVTSFEVLFPQLANGGIYVVEDTHTSFWAAYQSSLSIGNRTQQMGAIDYFCELIHLMMERWWNESSRGVFNLPRGGRPKIPVGTYAKSIHSISFFDSLIVIEKRDVPEPQRIRRK